ERADSLWPGGDLAARRARVGLGAVLSRRDRPVQGDGLVPGRADDILGPGRTSWVRLPRGALPVRPSRIRVDARTAQGHEVWSMVALLLQSAVGGRQSAAVCSRW